MPGGTPAARAVARPSGETCTRPSGETRNLYFEFGFFTELVDRTLTLCLRNSEVQMLFLNSPFQSVVSLVIFAFKFPPNSGHFAFCTKAFFACSNIVTVGRADPINVYVYMRRDGEGLQFEASLRGKQSFLLYFLCYGGLISQRQK